MDLLTWTMLHRRMLKPGQAFDLTRHPYLVDLYAQTAPTVVVYKAAQTGASEYLISYALHAADQRHATVLYVFPTDTHVSDFSSARIGAAIEASSYLADLVVDGGVGGQGGKRGADRVTLKRIRDRFLYLRGASVDPKGNAPQLKSIDADALILDELDEMDPRAPSIARKRLGHSLIAEERICSTPTYGGMGIHAEWGQTDQREWHVRCEHCDEWQTLTIRQVVTEWDQLERPVRWHGQAEERAFVACRKCGRELNRLAHGRWVPTWPGRDVAGYHITKLFSPTAHLLTLVQALQTTDETKRKEAFNQDLAEPYTPRGGRLTDDVLDACIRPYFHRNTRAAECVVGIDVGRVLHCVARGFNVETGERPQLFAGEADWGNVVPLIKRLGASLVVIDALPETTKARELQAMLPPGMVWLAYYSQQRTGLKQADASDWDFANGVVNLDRTRTLDELMALFIDQVNTLPANARDLPDVYDHLKAPTRVIEEAPGGARVARYVETGPDHFAHAENYCAVAFGAPRERTGYDDSIRVDTGY